MRRIVFACVALLLAVGLFGCDSPPEIGDFTFELPEGYRISEVTEKSCTIVNDQDVPVGGIIYTGLRAKDIRDSESVAFGCYLNEAAYGCEYFSWHGGDRSHPLQYMNMSVTNPDTQEKQNYYRVFFVKDSGVYDMWFDLSVMDEDSVSAFFPIAEAKD